MISISAAFPVLYAFYLLVSFFTIRYFTAFLQQRSWQAGDYFHILARDNQKWLPVVFSLVPSGALILGYGYLGAVILAVFAVGGSILYGIRAAGLKADWQEPCTRRCLLLWLILWGILLGICQPLENISILIPPVLCTGAYLFIPILVPILHRLELPMERHAGSRYVHVTGRVRELHSGLCVVVLTGNGESCQCAKALNAILSVRYRCEMASDPVKNAVEAAQVIRRLEDPQAEVLICRIKAETRDEIASIVQILQPSIVVQTSAEYWALSDQNQPDSNRALFFVNGDDEVLKQYVRPDGVLTYGLGPENDIAASVISVSELGTVFRIGRSRTKKAFFTTSLIGNGNVTSLAGAIGVALALGLSIDELRPAVTSLRGEPHRMGLSSEEGIVWIDDSDNGDPEDAEEALETLSRFDGEKILVTAGFPQLGAIQETANRNFGAKAAAVCGRIILVGEPVFGLKQGILDAGYVPEHLLTAQNVESARHLIRDLQKEAGQLAVLDETCSSEGAQNE